MIDDAEIPGFIAGLLKAAKEIDRVALDDRTRLLQRAAATIRDCRYEINYSDTPANDDGHRDIATHMMAVATNVEDFPDGMVAAVLLDAAETIRAAKVLMDAKLEILGLRDAEPEGRA